VVPIFSNGGTAIAEIDIDSHELSAFTDDDAKRLESLASELAPIVLQLIVR
jgi:putative methionine-R-sulfoxide reductase with GAF domain